MKILFRKASLDEQIEGERALIVQWPNGEFTVWCPKCGHSAGLSRAHRVTFNAAGELNIVPSLVCPAFGCDAHYFVKNSAVQML